MFQRAGYSIVSAVNHWARTRSTEQAIVEGDRETSWADLRRRVASRASDLGERGIGGGHTVAIMATNSLEWCVSALAIHTVGATILPVNPRTTASELSYLVDHAGCAAVLTDAGRRGTAENAIDAVTGAPPSLLDLSGGLTPARAGGPVSAPRLADPPAIVAYTSGTTGRPKGVELTHANLLIGSWFLARSDASRDVRILLVQPLSYTSGLISTFLAAMGNGWTLVLEPGFEPERALRTIEDQRVTTFRSVPLLWEEIADAPRFGDADLTHLRTVHVGGAPVPEELMSTWQSRGIDLCQGYGLTETCGAITFATPAQARRNRRTVGTGGPHCDIQLIGPDGLPASPGAVAEIQVRGPSVMRGYRSDSEATRAAVQDGWLRTGDLAVSDEEGALEIVGRARELIISGGINVYPAEIETVISAIPGVHEVAVVAVPHERYAEVPAAVVRVDASLRAEDVLTACRRELASHKVPHRVIVVDEPLPRTTSGKIIKRSVRDLYLDPTVA